MRFGFILKDNEGHIVTPAEADRVICDHFGITPHQEWFLCGWYSRFIRVAAMEIPLEEELRNDLFDEEDNQVFAWAYENFKVERVLLKKQ